jgi:ElaA protein
MIHWQALSFDQLSPRQLYDLLKLRVDIFVVEQQCPYPELDDKDTQPGVVHLLAYRNNDIVAYARLLPKGLSYNEVSIGRVVVRETERCNQLGHQLMATALEQCQKFWPDESITIGAQAHLQRFYARYGFIPVSEPYLEDGIPHIDMRLSRP